MNTILFTLSISLFDSLSTTQQIIIFILLLTTVKPVRNALWYLAGLSGAYVACGIVGYQVLDQLSVFLARYFPSASALPGPVYYQAEFFAGIIMTVLGIWYFRKKRHARPGRAQNMILAKLQSMNAFFAFCIGVFISVSSFPLSVPYLAALGKYTTLHLGLPAVTAYILLYNFGYALPMIIVLVVYLIARRDADYRTDSLHEKARVLNVQLTTWALAGFGLFSMVDAGCYFAIGRALIKGRFF
jgi:cytochrome c biogenesis protein CcdA